MPADPTTSFNWPRATLPADCGLTPEQRAEVMAATFEFMGKYADDLRALAQIEAQERDGQAPPET